MFAITRKTLGGGYLGSILIAAALAAAGAHAEFYWLVAGLQNNALTRRDAGGVNGAGSYLLLTNDVEGVEWMPVKVYDIRRTETGGLKLAKLNGANELAPYEGCPNGGADIDLTLPIRDANGTSYTFVGLGTEAFRDNNYLGSIKLPDTMEYISSGAFKFARYLREFSFPADASSMTVLADHVFDSCDRLESHIEWPPQFREVGEYSFANCFVFPGFCGPSVTNVGRNAFSACSALRAIEFGSADPIAFGIEPFRGDSNLKAVFFHDAPPFVNNNVAAPSGTGNSVIDWWGVAGATAYIPFNAGKDGPTDAWLAFKSDFEGAVVGNSVTWPVDNGDGTWTDGSIYVKNPNKTVRLRFWEPGSTASAALLAY